MENNKSVLNKLAQGFSNNKRSIIYGISFISIMMCAALCQAADAGGSDSIVLVSKATGQIKDFLKGDARQVIDVGLITGGAFGSLMKSSWLPVITGAASVLLFEILIKTAA